MTGGSARIHARELRVSALFLQPVKPVRDGWPGGLSMSHICANRALWSILRKAIEDRMNAAHVTVL